MDKQKGITLIELMVVVVILGLLAAAAVPTYGNYSKRAKYSEVIAFTGGYKSAAVDCILTTGSPAGCTDGANSTKNDRTTALGYIASITTLDGVITATGNGEVDNATYILTPTYAANDMTWVISGTCLDAENQYC